MANGGLPPENREVRRNPKCRTYGHRIHRRDADVEGNRWCNPGQLRERANEHVPKVVVVQVAARVPRIIRRE